ncbi:hypothetical protein MMPV_007557 [Pyropia vietnamensis]
MCPRFPVDPAAAAAVKCTARPPFPRRRPAALPLLICASATSAGPGKAGPAGEDAHFLLPPGGGPATSPSASSVGAPTVGVGVFDGVGGWRRLGIDAGDYARALAAGAAAYLAARPGPAGSAVVAGRWSAAEALVSAVDAVSLAGTATAVVAAVVADTEAAAGGAAKEKLEDGGGGGCGAWASAHPPPPEGQPRRSGRRLVGVSIGDSALWVIRAGTVVYRSPSLGQGAFNQPAQLGAGALDPLADASAIDVPLDVGDTVVVGSDGLFDNVWGETIVSTATRDEGGGGGGAVAEAARRLHAAAVDAYSARRYRSPFAVAARAAGWDYPDAGKPDDVVVVVCRAEASKGDKGGGTNL